METFQTNSQKMVADCAVRFEHSIIAVNEGMVAKKWHIPRQ